MNTEYIVFHDNLIGAYGMRAGIELQKQAQRRCDLKFLKDVNYGDTIKPRVDGFHLYI